MVERLNAGLARDGKLTLISAPAGFGKTTLVSEWIASCQRSVAWLSLDETDNDPTRFLVYLVTALQTLAFPKEHQATVSGSEGIAPKIGAGVLAAIHPPLGALE